jgi:hypothetical protein
MTENAHVDTRPWYRHVWPWILIAIPLAGIVMATITTVAAVRGADHDVRSPAEPPLEKSSWRMSEDGE